jgi:hypothetical protein
MKVRLEGFSLFEYRIQIMLGRRIDLRSAIDGLLLAVPTVLLCLVIPKHVARIGIAWSFDHPGDVIAGLDTIPLFFVCFYFGSFILGFAAMRSLMPPLRVTPVRLLLTLLLTLLAIALAAIDMVYVGF